MNRRFGGRSYEYSQETFMSRSPLDPPGNAEQPILQADAESMSGKRDVTAPDGPRIESGAPAVPRDPDRSFARRRRTLRSLRRRRNSKNA
jgi:hypothetical protein